MADRKRRSLPRLSRAFARNAKRPMAKLKEAFEKAHRLPKIRANFTKAVADHLKQTFSQRHLTLTPAGTRAVRGVARRSLAEKSIDIRKLPDTRPFRERPVRKQFQHTARRRGDTSNGRSS